MVGISHTYLDDSQLASLDFKGERGLANFIFTPGVELGIFLHLTVAYDWSEFPTEACDWSEFPKNRDSVKS